MVKVSGSPSTSVAVKVMGSAVSSSVLTDLSLATGGSSTGLIVMETVASLLSTVPSLALKVKESEPL